MAESSAKTASVGTTKGIWLSLVADADHGVLPAVLLLLTVVTGLVDAVSILALGRVFVANMTGNVVFVGFALAGAPGFSLAASLSALAGFVVGAGAGGQLVDRITGHRLRLARSMLAIELVLVGVALAASAAVGAHAGGASRDLIAAALALALGLQNAVVRDLKVPDLTTTVLTMTLTGIAADVRRQPHQVIVRRILAVAAMLVGAAVGTVLVLHVDPASALGVAEALIAAGLATVAIKRG